MKSIVDYRDYRRYLRDYFESRKKVSVFSWREFSKLAGFSSPNYMKLVCDGKTRLSKVRAKEVAKSLGLVARDQNYFEQLVFLDNAINDESKRKALAELQKIERKNRPRVIKDDAFAFYESWKFPVLRELAPLMPHASFQEMAAACNEKICASDVDNVLRYLVKTGFLKKDENGSFVQTEMNVVGSAERLPRAIRAMQQEMAGYAQRAIEKYTPEERHFLGVTFGINENVYKEIVCELENCRERITAITSNCKKINQVYRLNLQLFPFTKKV